MMSKLSILRYYCCACSLTFRRNCVGNSRILKILTICITIICSPPEPKPPNPVAVAAGPWSTWCASHSRFLAPEQRPLLKQGDRRGELGCAARQELCPARVGHALPRATDHTGLQPSAPACSEEQDQSQAWNHLLFIPP